MNPHPSANTAQTITLESITRQTRAAILTATAIEGAIREYDVQNKEHARTCVGTAINLIREDQPDPSAILHALSADSVVAWRIIQCVLRDIGGRRIRASFPRKRAWWEWLPRVLLRPFRRFIPSHFSGC